MTTTTVTPEKISPETAANVTGFILNCGGGPKLSEKHEGNGFSSDLIRSVLKTQHIHRGRVTCILTVKPYVCVLRESNRGYGILVSSIHKESKAFLSLRDTLEVSEFLKSLMKWKEEVDKE